MEIWGATLQRDHTQKLVRGHCTRVPKSTVQDLTWYLRSLNICKKQDSRASKNKPVVAIYTYEDCLSILFDDEQELRNWLIQLLSHQVRVVD